MQAQGRGDDPGIPAGVRVADFSRVLAGPYATMMLADFGADVITIRSPDGDETRTWRPPAHPLDIVLPSGLSSPRGALFDLDWITLAVMVVLLAIGAVYFLVARPDRRGPLSAGEQADDVVPVGR